MVGSNVEKIVHSQEWMEQDDDGVCSHVLSGEFLDRTRGRNFPWMTLIAMMSGQSIDFYGWPRVL